MDVDDLVSIKVLGWKRLAGAAVFEDLGVRRGGSNGLGVDTTVGVIDEDDALERGNELGGAALRIQIRYEGLKEGDVGPRRLPGEVGLGTDDEMGCLEVVEG